MPDLGSSTHIQSAIHFFNAGALVELFFFKNGTFILCFPFKRIGLANQTLPLLELNPSPTRIFTESDLTVNW